MLKYSSPLSGDICQLIHLTLRQIGSRKYFDILLCLIEWQENCRKIDLLCLSLPFQQQFGSNNNPVFLTKLILQFFWSDTKFNFCQIFISLQNQLILRDGFHYIRHFVCNPFRSASGARHCWCLLNKQKSAVYLIHSVTEQGGLNAETKKMS